jgi:hypothetical protein
MDCRAILGGVLVLFVAACSSAPEGVERTRPQVAQVHLPRAEARPKAHIHPRIVKTASRLQCVPYARSQSGIQIRGDAWSWWPSAKGKYRRGTHPYPGAVMVFSRTKRLKRGHLAFVKAVISPREIIVSQANWLNRGQIHEDVPVRDVSPNNDWSRVKVWYVPGNVLGKGRYAVSGFIYSNGSDLQQANAI